MSGINLGLNSGMDILYSGTVSAAVEANIYGIPSIAISAEYMKGIANYNISAKYALKVLEKTASKLLKTNIVLNLNTPYDLNDVNKELKLSSIGGPILDYYFIEDTENGEKALTLKGRKKAELVEGTDRYFLAKGYATITPLKYDLTNYDLLKSCEDWLR